MHNGFKRGVWRITYVLRDASDDEEAATRSVPLPQQSRALGWEVFNHPGLVILYLLQAVVLTAVGYRVWNRLCSEFRRRSLRRRKSGALDHVWRMG